MHAISSPWNRDSTWSIAPRSGSPIPIRSRLNFSVPSSSTIDRRPLCPPCEPDSRNRSLPNGSAKSSVTTRSSPSGTRSLASSLRTAIPESFMNVWGLARIRSRPLYRSSSVELASRWRPRPDRPARSASRSSTNQPMLWRVSAYWLPGLPRPTTSFTSARRNSLRDTANGPGTVSDGARRRWYRGPEPRRSCPRHLRRCGGDRSCDRLSRLAGSARHRAGRRRGPSGYGDLGDGLMGALHLGGTRAARRAGGGRLRGSVMILAIVSIVAACGDTTPTPSPSPATTRPTPMASTGPDASPSTDPVATPTPTPPPPDTAWSAVIVPDETPVATLEPTRSGAGGVATTTEFRLTSLDGTAPAALASRLRVDPAVKLAVASTHGRTAILRPAAALRPGTLYRVSLLGADGTIEASWAAQTAGPLHIVESIPATPRRRSPSTPASSSSSTRPASAPTTSANTCGSSPRPPAGSRPPGGPSCSSREAPAPRHALHRDRHARPADRRHGPAARGGRQDPVRDRRPRDESRRRRAAPVVRRGHAPRAGRAVDLVGERGRRPAARACPGHGPSPRRHAGGRGRVARRERRPDVDPRRRATRRCPTTGLPKLDRRAPAAPGRRRGPVVPPPPAARARAGTSSPSRGRASPARRSSRSRTSPCTPSSPRPARRCGSTTCARPARRGRVRRPRRAPARRHEQRAGLLVGHTPAAARSLDTGAPPRRVLLEVRRRGPHRVPADRHQRRAVRHCECETTGDDELWQVITSDRYRYRSTDTVNAWGVVRNRDTGAVPASLRVSLLVGEDGDESPLPISTSTATPDAIGAFAVAIPLRALPAGSYRLEVRPVVRPRRRAVVRGRHDHEARLPADDQPGPTARSRAARPSRSPCTARSSRARPSPGRRSSLRPTRAAGRPVHQHGRRRDRQRPAGHERQGAVDRPVHPGHPDPARGGRASARRPRSPCSAGTPSSTSPARSPAGASGSPARSRTSPSTASTRQRATSCGRSTRMAPPARASTSSFASTSTGPSGGRSAASTTSC